MTRTLYAAAAACVILAVFMWHKTSDINTPDKEILVNNQVCLVTDKECHPITPNAIVHCHTGLLFDNPTRWKADYIAERR